MSNQAPQRITQGATTVGGIHTNYYQAGNGNGEVLLMLHGMSASADSFRELMIDLSQDYRTIAPDIPGFGDTGDTKPYTFPRLVNWLHEFVDSVGASPAHLVGHSFGGALAVSFAMSAPPDVDSLILLAPSVLRPGKYPEWLRGLARSPVSEWVLGLGVTASRFMLQRQMRAAFHDPSQFGPELWQRREHDYKRARASAAVLRASALHDIRANLHTISQRSCIIWGQDDPVLDPGDAQQLNELMPASRTELHLLRQCGHVPHIEQREQVVDIMNQFLNGVDNQA